MTKPQANKLTTDIAKEYLFNCKDLSSVQAELWEKELTKLDYGIARSALGIMFSNHPACEEPFNGKMPYLITFTEYYDDLISPRLKYCPCCCGSGFATLSINGHEGVTICDCIPEIDAEKKMKTLGWPDKAFKFRKHFTDNQYLKCFMFLCEPREGHPCPTGNNYYNGQKIEFMNRMKQSPAYKLGLTFSKHRKLHISADVSDDDAATKILDNLGLEPKGVI